MDKIHGPRSQQWWKPVKRGLWDNARHYNPARWGGLAHNALRETMHFIPSVVFDATYLWNLGSRQENSTAATTFLAPIFLYVYISILSTFLYFFISTFLHLCN